MKNRRRPPNVLQRPMVRWSWFFLLPMVSAFAIGFVWPFLQGIYLSFCDFRLISDAKWVGLKNYISVFQDTNFMRSFGYTAVFAVVSLAIINVLAFMVAYVLTLEIKGSNIFRTVFFMPNLIGGIVLGYIWQLIFDGIFSHFNTALKLDANLGFIGLVILICWQQIGYMMIVYIAGLQAIPESLKEAAMIDGCNPLQTFFMIVMPMLKPTMVSVAILEAMWVWNDYLLPTLVLDIREYQTIPMLIQTSFKGGYGRVEMGAMMACIMLTVIPIVIVYLLGQKHIIKGVAAGAVKG